MSERGGDDQVSAGGGSQRQGSLGGGLRRAWIGYQRRLDEAMAAAGFADRAFPDGRVLRLCARSQVTAASIGRELGITRQGAGKLVAQLRDRGYVTLEVSPADAREKAVALTPLARDYLAAQRTAARRIEEDVLREVGPEAMESLWAVIGVLAGADAQPRLRDYMRRALRLGDVAHGD